MGGGKMFPKEGNVLPPRSREGASGKRYAATIAAALRAELGETYQAIKIVMRWTGANERTVMNWLGATLDQAASTSSGSFSIQMRYLKLFSFSPKGVLPLAPRSLSRCATRWRKC